MSRGGGVWVGVWLFVVFQGAYLVWASGRVERVADEFEVAAQVESLWERGSLAIPQVPDAVFFGRVGRGGERYAPYGPGMAFLALGHHGLGRWSAGWLGLRRGSVGWTAWVRAITSLATSTFAALAVAGVFAAGRALGGGVGRSARVAVCVGASVVGAYGTWFFSEPMAAALVVWAFAAAASGRSVWAGLALGALVLVKATYVVVVPGFLVWGAWRGRGRGWLDVRGPWVGWGLAVLAALAVHAEWNRYRFGDPTQFGYDWGELVSGAPRPFGAERWLEGLWGLVGSPGKGVVWFAPVVVLGVWGWRSLWRRRRGAAVCVAVSSLGVWAFFGAYFYWEGGYCFGPRFLVPVIPLAALPAAVGRWPRWLGGWVLGVGLSVTVLGVGVNFMEDQALGGEAQVASGEAQERYYRLREEAPAGKPRNVYRLGYCPWGRYVGVWVGYLRGREAGVGEGLEFARGHLERVGREWGEGPPGWAGWVIPLGGVFLLATGAWGIRRRFSHNGPKCVSDSFGGTEKFGSEDDGARS